MSPLKDICEACLLRKESEFANFYPFCPKVPHLHNLFVLPVTLSYDISTYNESVPQVLRRRVSTPSPKKESIEFDAFDGTTAA